jgi:hypothetical protein
LQAASIESRLNVPGQGSPKSPFEAGTVQVAFPRQADDTVLAELEAWQVLTANDPQEPVGLP